MGGSLTYVNSNKDCPNNQPCSLYSYDGVWRLATYGKELFYVAESASELPPLNGWVIADGSAPAPTLKAGPTTTAAAVSAFV